MRFDRPKCLRALAVVVASITCCGAGAPTTRPPTMAELKAENRKALAYWQSLPVLPTRPMARVLRLGVADGHLKVDWPIFDPSPVEGRLSIADVRGEARISSVQRRAGGHSAGGSMPAGAVFELYDFSDPRIICRSLQVLDCGVTLQVVDTVESADGVHDVSLLQTINALGTVSLTLRVQGMDGPEVVLTAPTLWTLRREHPAEFEHYLRPLFEAFHQEQAVFRVDDRAAWEVMRAQWRPPAGLAKQVQDLIARMNADEYSLRQEAERQLRDLGQPAALYLLTASQKSLTAEQKVRIDGFLADFCPLTAAQAKACSVDVNFLLDCLGSDDADLRAATSRQLGEAVGHSVTFDVNQPAAARQAAIASLRAALAPPPSTRGAAD